MESNIQNVVEELVPDPFDKLLEININNKLVYSIQVLSDQLSLTDCIYFFRYWEVCVL